jgi:hypothetical protein
MATGISVTKAVVYSVLGPAGIAVSNANVYAVVGGGTGISVSKSVVYSVLGPKKRSFMVFLTRMIAERNGQ